MRNARCSGVVPQSSANSLTHSLTHSLPHSLLDLFVPLLLKIIREHLDDMFSAISNLVLKDPALRAGKAMAKLKELGKHVPKRTPLYKRERMKSFSNVQ